MERRLRATDRVSNDRQVNRPILSNNLIEPNLGIIVGVQTAKVANELSNGGTTSSNCVSQGGTNPNC